MNFFKIFFASLLDLVVFCLLGIFLFVGILGSLSSEKEVLVAENSILHLKLDAAFTEIQQENPLAGIPIVGSDVQNIGLIQLKQSIKHAKDDANIKGIYLEVSSPAAGFSTLQEIREALIDFKTSGKW